MLTVREAILFAARLRLPEYVTDAEKRQRVDDVIEQFSLAHVRDSRIGGRTTDYSCSRDQWRRDATGQHQARASLKPRCAHTRRAHNWFVSIVVDPW